jgi:peptidoglycan/xylan/chitin deacetylase (PgdA/CDA1 family)
MGRPALARILSRAALAVLASVIAWNALSWTQPQWAFGLIERLTPNVVWRVRTGEPLVGLSFDDGPDPDHTPIVLEILRRQGAKATFFLIGERALRHPLLVRRLKDEGHEVANHYFMSGAVLGHSDADLVAYLDRTEAAINLTGPVRLFRPPGGVAWPRQLRLARERGYRCVLGSAYPHDPAHPPVAYMRWLVEKNLVPGTIVILHDGIADPSKTIEALPGILEAGARRGLRFVPVGRLMATGRGN